MALPLPAVARVSEVRRAPIGPGLRLGPRRQARWVGGDSGLARLLALSAWELACHALPTIVFAVQRLFALSVSARHRPSQTVASGTQRVRQHSPQVSGNNLIR